MTSILNDFNRSTSACPWPDCADPIEWTGLAPDVYTCPGCERPIRLIRAGWPVARTSIRVCDVPAWPGMTDADRRQRLAAGRNRAAALLLDCDDEAHRAAADDIITEYTDA